MIPDPFFKQNEIDALNTVEDCRNHTNLLIAVFRVYGSCSKIPFIGIYS